MVDVLHLHILEIAFSYGMVDIVFAVLDVHNDACMKFSLYASGRAHPTTMKTNRQKKKDLIFIIRHSGTPGN